MWRSVLLPCPHRHPQRRRSAPQCPFHAPNATLGALDATNATLGRLKPAAGSAGGDLVPEVVVPGAARGLLLPGRRRGVRRLVLRQLDDVRRLARLDVPQPPPGFGLDLRRVAQLRLAALELSDLLLQLSLLGLLFADLGPLGEVRAQGHGDGERQRAHHGRHHRRAAGGGHAEHLRRTRRSLRRQAPAQPGPGGFHVAGAAPRPFGTAARCGPARPGSAAAVAAAARPPPVRHGSQPSALNRGKASSPAYRAASPRVSSMRSSWLYLAIRSPRAGAPVLIWPTPVATARSAMNVSSVSPERWLIIDL